MAGGENVYIDWIKNNMPTGSAILEFGSGHFSTKELSETGYEMHSIESEEKYIGMYESNYIWAPMKDGWYDTGSLGELPDYELIICDGPRGLGNKSRHGFWTHRNMFNLMVPIIFHDIDRPAEQDLMHLFAMETGRQARILDNSVHIGQSGIV